MKLNATNGVSTIPVAADEVSPNGGPDRERRRRQCGRVHNFDHILMISNGRLQSQDPAGMAAPPPQRAAAADKGREE